MVFEYSADKRPVREGGKLKVRDKKKWGMEITNIINIVTGEEHPSTRKM